MTLEISRCTFAYRRGGTVLNRLSLTFDSGCTVLLGPNGAGKSTLLGIAATALAPQKGQVSLGGLTPDSSAHAKAYRRRVGWLPQQVRPVAGLKLREQVAYAGWLKGMSRRAAWDAAGPALDRVGLGELSGRTGRQLSGGQLRRLGIAQTLVHQAEVVLLDEPTAGLDPHQRGVFRDLIGDLAHETSFVVSTHQTEDLAEIFDSVVVLDRGNVRFQGSVPEFLGTAPADAAPGRLAEAAYAGFVRGEV
ncbi:ATP-binding cassette domain-containing protein [Streptomyces aureoverticillatus]|uniref:ATP-binding cassette domain-containing protein n=1 Tax=Streptomyces aureoverticillatus TaxID=66871 RepID=UPI0013D9E030|nr:ATP-binding cassette domain-containing protein [Streptomyces aureoverticillatus]QIB44953.1 ATP-binding cassette domain-containing protein [Streptomyces aureoverticillatus]